tara:strand:+ start:1071 stop:1241 length:171 start_codon:yes stop_codon:yes gene_type:complete
MQVITGPTGVTHEGHLGIKEGQFVASGLPPVLQKVFEQVSASAVYLRGQTRFGSFD